MPSSSSHSDDDVSPEPATAHKAPAAVKKDNHETKEKGKEPKDKSHNVPATPTKKAPAGSGDTPRSAPAATHQRQRSNSKKPADPPNLLADFLMGRPSPARLAAERERRKSVEAVKAELRHEMRQGTVRKTQAPGGVKDRVKAWQTANAAVVVPANPDDAATEPTEVAFDGEDTVESVTEEDRIRIKTRQRSKYMPKTNSIVHASEYSSTKPSDNSAGDEGSKPPPKKRVVSDDNWMKTKNRKTPPRRVSPKTRRHSPPGQGVRIPKNFTLRTAPNANVRGRVKAWAEKVEVPDTPPPRSYRSSHSRSRSAFSEGTETELLSEGGDSSSQVTARMSLRPKQPSSTRDEVTRVKPVRKKIDGDGIRVKAVSSSQDDESVVGPTSDLPSEAVTSQTASTRVTRERSKTLPSSRSSESEYRRTRAAEEPSELLQSTVLSRSEVAENSEVAEKPGSLTDTPTKCKGSKPRASSRERPKSYNPGMTKAKHDASWIDDGASNLDRSQLLGSDLASSLANKSLADLQGDIPFGHSAFSELDLPLHGPARSRPKRPAVDKSASLKGMPNVFKKVMEESKKMIHEMNEPPKQPPTNNPPSIEKWLNNTVDPFVDDPKKEAKPTKQPSATKQDTPESGKESTSEPTNPPVHEAQKRSGGESAKQVTSEPEKRTTPERAKESSPESSYSKDKTRRRSSHGTRTSRTPPSKADRPVSRDMSTPTESSESQSRSESTSKHKTSDSPGLKRRRAVRSTLSPSKSADKHPFFGMLKEAFQGESSDYRKSSFTYYQSQEERRYEQDDMSDDRTMSGYESRSSYLHEETPTTSELSSADSAEPTTPKMAGPRLRPPTNGNHELSTIMSEEDSSVIDSDLISDVSRSTVTQSTVLTKDSDLSRSKTQEPGLKRRLTKHSDLVSVLSLPDNRSIPNTIKSTRSRPSLRKTRGCVDHVTADELLKEFSADEDLYMKELKTLVDGVVPVLLSQVVQDGNYSGLFRSDSPSQKLDSLSKSVVGMGVSLEKLRNAHKKAPHHDIRRLAHWAHGVVPIYNSYLNSWRLGFHNLVVNLAPAAGIPEDEDSLLNAMPRNESGDVINSEGERVDVAHLLKRPLIRIKHMVKLFECMNSMIHSEDTQELLKNFKDLQDKSRRRHREETARMADEEAINTDTTRARDLRTLGAIESVTIDPSRQVNAKDIFSLDLTHSNGQRLECRVELVHRDNQKEPDDRGDLLIRETGDGRRTYLLFPPLSISSISARTGEGNFDMVVMIRGTCNGRPWHELLTLTSDNEDQILDWLDILPLTPVPPREPEPSVIGDDDEEPPSARQIDIPVGARSIRRKTPRSSRDELPSQQRPVTPKRSLSSHYHRRQTRLTSTPPRVEEDEDSTQEKTPTQGDYAPRSQDPDEDYYSPSGQNFDRSLPLSEGMRPDPQRLTKRASAEPYYREDGAPPPPVHRTFSKGWQAESESSSAPGPSIEPPAEFKNDGKARSRQSSPLKNEYLPSDRSSTSGVSADTGSEPDYSDSDDEIESIDVPETELGVSIKEEEPEPEPERKVPAPVQSVVGESECSLTPSNSASQTGLHDQEPVPEESSTRYMASISRWSDRGVWKDITSGPCSIVVTPGLIEAYPIEVGAPGHGQKTSKPLLAMDLTPLVLIRQSTTVDLEIRSSVQAHCRLYETYGGGNFRFRCQNGPDCFSLYMSVHHARLNNQKFIQLENEARFRGFGENRAPPENNGDTSSRRRTWFGRKNSYRSSVRAPSQSQDGASTTPSSNVSASSFLKRLTVAGNLTFNLARSSVDKQSIAGSVRNSLYTSGSSSASGTPPRSPSISMENSGHSPASFNCENIRIRLHLLVGAAKWEDYGNCSLQIRQPPPGWHQALRADHGLEKRITVTTLPRKETEQPRILLDAVLGSGCFSPMGSRGIVCGVWEEVKDGRGVVGMVPATGATGGNIKKWCFQCATVAEASWVLRLVHQEVLRA